MRSHEPPRGWREGCDCSSFARWAMAQAGADIGTHTGNIWTARGALPSKHNSGRAWTPFGLVLRGYHRLPPGGDRASDLIFYGSPAWTAASGMWPSTWAVAVSCSAPADVAPTPGSASTTRAPLRATSDTPP
jgi:hypothetical protein